MIGLGPGLTGRWKRRAVLVALLLAPAACAAPTSTPTAAPSPTETAESTTAPVSYLQNATVQVKYKVVDDGRQVTFAHGSGSLISPDGLVLTNAHVADPLNLELGAVTGIYDPAIPEPDALVVAVIEAEDSPPVERYLAEIAAVDGNLDLAVLRIVRGVDGSVIEPDDLDLPHVDIGASANVHLGDAVSILGFPGIGGDTITLTRGTVSGFEEQDRIGRRAWIKTDSAVSAGNSGGMAIDGQGRLIGVPTAAYEALGGAVNRLRGIDSASALIEAARAGRPYVSPYLIAGGGRQRLSLVGWTDAFDAETGCPTGETRRAFSSNPAQLVAVFDYAGMTDGELIVEEWTVESDTESFDLRFPWLWGSVENVLGGGGESGPCLPVPYPFQIGWEVPSGEYSVTLRAGPGLRTAGEAQAVVAAEATESAEGVYVAGRITDADTGRGVPGAGLIVLRPGVDTSTWLSELEQRGWPSFGDVLISAEADEDGGYRLPSPLARGTGYGVVALHAEYLPKPGSFEFDAGDADVVTVDIELTR